MAQTDRHNLIDLIRQRLSRQRMRRKVLLVTAVIVAAIVAFIGFRIWIYPARLDHCCIRQMGIALEQYANDNGGFYPAGGATPEASLSLLCPKYVPLGLVRGKFISQRAAQKALDTYGFLTPETCGWHYVEGLTLSDDPKIAILWDKLEVGHTGQPLPGGGHEVIFVGNWAEEIIYGSNWPGFESRQQGLLASRNPKAVKGLPALSATIRLPSGEIVDHYDGTYVFEESWQSQTASCSGSTASGSTLPRSELVWYQPLHENATSVLKLSLPAAKMHSKPVTVRFTSGVASPDSIVFEMENN